MSVVEFTSEDQFTEFTSQTPHGKLSILYFHTPWAAPCVSMSKVFATLAQANSDINFCSINADELSNIAELFEVASVPHFVLIKDSTILKELNGADPKELVYALSEFRSGTLNDHQNQDSQQTQAPPVSTQKPSSQPSTNTPTEKKEESPEELNARLEKLTQAAPVMVFIKGTPSEPKCGFSRQLIAILREHQVKFGFFDILKDNSVRQGLKTFSDWPTFPQLYIKGEFQGGLDIIKENLEEDPDFFNTTFNA